MKSTRYRTHIRAGGDNGQGAPLTVQAQDLLPRYNFSNWRSAGYLRAVHDMHSGAGEEIDEVCKNNDQSGSCGESWNVT